MRRWDWVFTLGDEPRTFPPGKLPADVLSRLLKHYRTEDERLLIGPEVGSDAAAIDFGDRVVVVKSDPITFPTPSAGRYLVNVNANDIACMGATPRWLLVTALLPETSTTEDLVERLFSDLHVACIERGIALVGGHTEITIGLDRPILVGQMIGETTHDRLLDLRRARAGDRVILINGIAIEGTAILAAEAPPELLAPMPEGLLASARAFLTSPGISVVPAAKTLIEEELDVRGMHDPTEGGLATALREIAHISGLGMRVRQDAITVHPETEAICGALSLDPLGLIASGALLAVVSAGDTPRAIGALAAAGFDAAEVAELVDDQEITIETGSGHVEPLPVFDVDEIARFFAGLEQ